MFESNRNPENPGACHPAGCRRTLCHDRGRCSNPLVATSTPTRKRLCPHGARGERPARLGGRSCSISAGNKSSGLLLCRRRSLQLDQARFQQRRRRQHGHCFRASISLVTAQTDSRVIAVALRPSLLLARLRPGKKKFTKKDLNDNRGTRPVKVGPPSHGMPACFANPVKPPGSAKMSPDSAQPTRRAANVLTIPSYWKMLDVPVAAVRPLWQHESRAARSSVALAEKPAWS